MNNKESIFHRLEVDLNEGVPHEKLFPEYFNPEAQKVKILFVAPRMDAFGYYQQILPALFFNRKQSKYTTACITNIAKSKQELDCTIDETYTISVKMIEMANIIVFPFTEQDLTPAYRAIRGINKSAKICYTVDYDFYNVPKTHDRYDLLKKEKTILTIESNIFYSDKVFVPRQQFIPYLAEKLNNKFPEERSIVVDTIPFYISSKNYGHINMANAPEIAKKPGIIRIGIISHWHTLDDLVELKQTMEWLAKKYPKKFEFYIWGADFTTYEPKKPGRKAAKKGKQTRIPKKVIPRTHSFLYYYKDLYNMNIDCLLVHRKDNQWNQMNREPMEILDASFYRIPVITNVPTKLLLPSTFTPYRSIDELKAVFDEMSKSVDPIKHVAQAAREFVIANHSIDPDGVKIAEVESVYLSFESENIWKDDKQPTPAADPPKEPVDTESQ